jgi:hypothetical protein
MKANMTDLTIETVNVKGIKSVVIPVIKSCDVTAPEAVPARYPPKILSAIEIITRSGIVVTAPIILGRIR